MRSAALRVALCAFAGLLVTVMIAWAAALFSRITRVDIVHDPSIVDGRLVSASPWRRWRVPADWEVNTHVVGTGPGIRYGLVTESVWMGSRLGMISGSKNRSMERVRVGWPLAALEYRGGMDDWVRAAGGAVSPWLAGIEPPIRSGRLYMGAERRLPVRPVWAGLAVDAALYAAAVFGIAAARRAVVRRSRRRRGRCPRCGYDVRALESCPECGPD